MVIRFLVIITKQKTSELARRSITAFTSFATEFETQNLHVNFQGKIFVWPTELAEDASTKKRQNNDPMRMMRAILRTLAKLA